LKIVHHHLRTGTREGDVNQQATQYDLFFGRSSHFTFVPTTLSSASYDFVSVLWLYFYRISIYVLS
jgi:hypothetical protein